MCTALCAFVTSVFRMVEGTMSLHKDKLKAVSTSHSVGSYFHPQALHLAIEAETRWSCSLLNTIYHF